MQPFQSDQGYRIQSVDVLAIADQFGLPRRTYTMLDTIESALLRSSFSGVNLKIKYAAKALDQCVHPKPDAAAGSDGFGIGQ
jgi:hypothetical protein